MSVRSAQAVTVTFFTETGADADSLPTAELVLNGADNASATVTHVSTGRYTAAVTLPTLAIGDIVEIAVSATVASAAEKFVAWRDTADIAVDVDANVISVNGNTISGGNIPANVTQVLGTDAPSDGSGHLDVRLADGVSHAGGDAMLSLSRIVVYSPDNNAVSLTSGAANKNGLLITSGGGTGAGIYVAGGDSGPAIHLDGPYTTPGPVVLIDATGDDSSLDGGPGILVRTGAGHGIHVTASGSGSKALLLSGDAATDALAIAAGAGSPVDIFNADGSVNAALTETGLDAVDDSELTAAPANFRQRLRWLCQRFGTKGAKTKSGTSGTIVVKTAAGATATTQNYTDDGAGNQTQDNAS